MNSHTPNFDPFLSKDELNTRHEARQEMSSWLTQQLDAVDLMGNPALQMKTSAYFNRFSESLQDKIRKTESLEAHNALPHGLAVELETPIPATIPTGATTYFRTLLEDIKFQIESLEQEFIPDWLGGVLDILHLETADDYTEEYAEQLIAKIRESVADYEDVPEWLADALDLRDTAIPEGETQYFHELPTRIEAIMHDQENKSAWLENALQHAMYPPIPEGNEAYFSGFSSQVRATIAEMEALEQEELHEPTTVERLVSAPDQFHQILEELEHLELPVGQELYFDDFSDRVKSRIKERGLVKLPKNPVVLFMLRPPVQWAAAACFGFLIGFFWFGTSQPAGLLPEKTGTEQNAPAPLPNQEMPVSPVLKPENKDTTNQP